MLYLLVIIISLLLKSFFAGAEMALISSNKLKLRFLASRGNKAAQKVMSILSKPQIFLSTALIGNNLSLIIVSAFVSRLIASILPGQWVHIATSSLMLPVVLFFTEIIPMSIGRLNATRLSLRVIRLLYFSYYVLFPLVKFFSFLSEKIVTGFRLTIKEKQPFPTREEMQCILESETQDQFILEEETGMIKKVLQFHKILVDDVMIPMDKVVSANATETCANVIQTMQQSGFSRIPVYDGSIANVIGVIIPRELLNAAMSQPVKRYLKKPYSVPLKTPIITVLWDLQMNARQTVIVRDEAAQALGILTLEDIMEKVVGSITDEYDFLDGDTQS